MPTNRYVVKMHIISVFRPTPYDTYFEIKIVSTNELKHAFVPINTKVKLKCNSKLHSNIKKALHGVTILVQNRMKINIRKKDLGE